MTQKELRTALEIKQEIDRKEGELNDLRVTGGLKSPVFDAVRGSRSTGVAQIVVELDEELTELKALFDIERETVENFIENIEFENEIQKEVMFLRYVRCLPWELIRYKIGSSVRRAYQIHAEGCRIAVGCS